MFSIKLDEFTNTKSLDKVAELHEVLNEQRLSAKDTGVNYRVINHWDEKGIIRFTRATKDSNRKFSFIDFIWIKIVNELRSFGTQKEAVLEELEKLNQKLSNPKELIHFACKLATNLAPVWSSGDYFQKQVFQNVLFPNGLLYDVKIEHYRTPVVNSIIACIADLSKDSDKIKKPDSLNLLEKSGSVSGEGLETSRLTAYAPQAYLYTNSNIRTKNRINIKQKNRFFYETVFLQ